MTITIKNLTFTLDSLTVDSRAANPFAALLDALESGSIRVHTADDHEGESDAAPAAAPAPEGNGTTGPANPTPEDVQDLVLDALHDERYDLRTFDGLAKSVQKAAAPTPVTLDAVQDALNSLVDEGEAYTRRRRSDGAALYGAA